MGGATLAHAKAMQGQGGSAARGVGQKRRRRRGILRLLNAEGALGDVEAQGAPDMAEHSYVSDLSDIFVQARVW